MFPHPEPRVPRPTPLRPRPRAPARRPRGTAVATYLRPWCFLLEEDSSEQTDAELNRKDGFVQPVVRRQIEAHVQCQRPDRGDVADAGARHRPQLERLPGLRRVPEIPRLEEHP